jgi:putative hydrolase
MIKLVADLHIHSVASGHAYSTVGEIIEAARNKGLEMVAITDHGPAVPDGPHPFHFANLRVLPEEVGGLKILKGVEANIINEQGELDLEPFYLERLDIILAGFHMGCFPSNDSEVCTRAIMNAMDNHYVDIIVHPGNPEFPVDFDIVVKRAAEKGIPLEINNSSFCGSRRGSEHYCPQVAELIAGYGALTVIGSDAHFATNIGEFQVALETVQQAGVRPDQVLNTSVEKVLGYLAQRRKLRQVYLSKI